VYVREEGRAAKGAADADLPDPNDPRDSSVIWSSQILPPQ
jgi:hypothetical protein